MPVTLDPQTRAVLTDTNFCHVSTIQPDGTPHTVVTWVDVEDDNILLNTVEGRVWPTNLRRDPRVTLTIAKQENPYEYVSIRGRMVEATHTDADEHIDRMAMKYLGKERYPFRKPGEQRLLIKVASEHIRPMASSANEG
jgi:PPOX class probable F420-dependent enzyme